MASTLRTSMSDLIARVRTMIQDFATSGTPAQFADTDIQDALDAHKTFVRYAILEPRPTLNVGGILAYNDFFANVGDWESDAVLYGPAYAPITTSSADYITGHWQTNLPSPGQILPVSIVGTFYDRFAAAADLLEYWAAAWARNYAFSSDGASFQRQQAAQMMQAQAQKYRQQSKPHIVKQTRDDLSETQTSFGTLLGNAPIDLW